MIGKTSRWRVLCDVKEYNDHLEDDVRLPHHDGIVGAGGLVLLSSGVAQQIIHLDKQVP